MNSLEPTSFRQLIDRVVPLARPHFFAAFPATAIPLAIAGILLVVMQHRLMNSLLVSDIESTVYFLAGLILSFGLIVIAYVVTYSMLAIAAIEVVQHGGPLRLGDAWRRLFSLRLFGTVSLWTIVSVASLVLCLAPALLVVPLLAFTLNVAIVEERYGLDALKRSAHWVWWSPTGRPLDSAFLRVFVLIFIGWGVQSGVGLVFQGPLAGLQQYYVLRDAAGGVEANPAAAMGPLWVAVAGQFFNAMASAVAWLYWAFGFAMLYVELRRQREATDLREAILELTEPAAGTTEPAPASI